MEQRQASGNTSLHRFVPRIEILLEKERKHLRFLKSREYLDPKLIGKQIKYSKQMIEHLKLRIKQYKEYTT